MNVLFCSRVYVHHRSYEAPCHQSLLYASSLLVVTHDVGKLTVVSYLTRHGEGDKDTSSRPAHLRRKSNRLSGASKDILDGEYQVF